jgi:hypothetical protein
LQDMGRDAMEMWDRESSLWSVDCSSTHKSQVADVEILVATRMIIIWICRLCFTGICCLERQLSSCNPDSIPSVRKNILNTHEILLAKIRKNSSQLPVVIESDCGQLVAAVCDRAQDRSSYIHIIISEIKLLLFFGNCECKIIKVDRKQVRLSHCLANWAEQRRELYAG